MKYIYFVSYYITYNYTKSGFGSTEIEIDKEINDVDDLREIEKLLVKDINEKTGSINGKATIINFQLLRKEEKK